MARATALAPALAAGAAAAGGQPGPARLPGAGRLRARPRLRRHRREQPARSPEELRAGLRRRHRVRRATATSSRPRRRPTRASTAPAAACTPRSCCPTASWGSGSAQGPQLPAGRDARRPARRSFDGPLPITDSDGSHGEVVPLRPRPDLGRRRDGPRPSSRTPSTSSEDAGALAAQVRVFRQALWGYLGIAGLHPAAAAGGDPALEPAAAAHGDRRTQARAARPGHRA